MPVQEIQETQIQSLGREDPLKESMATHSSLLAWRIPWTEEPGGLQSIGLHRVEHNWSDCTCAHTILFWFVICFEIRKCWGLRICSFSGLFGCLESFAVPDKFCICFYLYKRCHWDFDRDSIKLEITLDSMDI